MAKKNIFAWPKHNCEKSTYICALAINTYIKVIHAFDKFYYFDSIKKHVLKHGYHTSGALSISTPPPSPHPQPNTLQVKFTLSLSHIMGFVMQVTSFSISVHYGGAWSASRPVALPSLP